MEKIMNSDFEVRLARLEKLGGDVTKVYNSDFEVSLAILEKLSGQPQNANDYNSVYEVDIEILKYEGGGSPTPPTPTEPVEDTIWFENTTSGTTTVTFDAYLINAKDVKVSADGENYVSETYATSYYYPVPQNSRIYVKYTPTYGFSSSTRHPFSIGNITKIGGELKNAGKDEMYYYWLKDNKVIEDISELKIESATANYMSCQGMFQGCTNLKNTCQINVQSVGEKSFYAMFSGCTNVTDCFIEDLGGVTNGVQCYGSMFSKCSKMKNAPKLSYDGPMSERCYNSMFNGCTSLTEAPELPSTVMANYCYSDMFQGCTSLTKVPTVLPAEILKSNSYQNMFNGCTALETAPNIMATTLSGDCMNSMFMNCTALTTPPSDLYAEYDNKQCYNNMFYGCTSLLKTPKIHLREITAASSCYQMFYNCKALSEIYIEALTIKTNDASTYNIFGEVGATGTVYLPKNIDKDMWVIGSYGLPSGWTIDQTVIDCFPENILIIKNEDTDVNHITLSGNTSISTTTYEKSVFFYSTDNGQTYNEFKVMDRNSFDVALGVGESLYLKGFYNIKKATQSQQYVHQWRSSGKISISGEYKNGGKFILASSFQDNKNIIDASGFVVNMPLIWYDCNNMFNGCNSLVHPCQLPQTTVGYYSYSYMFNNCTSLTELPQLPATTLDSGCYSYMFYSCQRLTETPKLIAKVLKDSCYSNMFASCSKITSVEIYAEILSSSCFTMMLQGCTLLNSIYCNSLLPVSGSANNWVRYISATGTFYYNPKTDWALTVARGFDTIPTNWDVQPWLTE